MAAADTGVAAAGTEAVVAAMGCSARRHQPSIRRMAHTTSRLPCTHPLAEAGPGPGTTVGKGASCAMRHPPPRAELLARCQSVASVAEIPSMMSLTSTSVGLDWASLTTLSHHTLCNRASARGHGWIASCRLRKGGRSTGDAIHP